MLKLTYDVLTVTGWEFREETFTKAEKRTAVEVAREKVANPAVREVGLVEMDLKKGEIPVFAMPKPSHLYNPTQIGVVKGHVLVLGVIDLKRLPRPTRQANLAKVSKVEKEKAGIGAAFTVPVKKPRVSKRERTFGTKELVS